MLSPDNTTELDRYYQRHPDVHSADILKGRQSPPGAVSCPSCGHDDAARVSTLFAPTIYVACHRCYDGPGSPLGSGLTVADAVESWNDAVEVAS